MLDEVGIFGKLNVKEIELLKTVVVLLELTPPVNVETGRLNDKEELWMTLLAEGSVDVTGNSYMPEITVTLLVM